ncbi:MAG: hypothetical protein HZA46_24805 [Planctomycetales bacterium]|nr:hypothetical protein [Planctomycetales bacterium]
MAGRKVLAGVVGLAAIGIAGMFVLNGTVLGKGTPFTDELSKSERVVVVVPTETGEVAGGGEFHAKIDRVLRGSGAKDDELHVVLGKDVKQPLKFDSRREYVLFLARNKGGEGWLSIGAVSVTFANGRLNFIDGKGSKHELSVDEFKSLLAKKENQYAAPKTPTRTNLQGEWVIVFTEQVTDIYGWVLTIAKGDQGAWQTNLKRSTELLGKSGFEVKSSTVTDDRAEITLVRDDPAFTFSGKLDKGIVFGSLAVGDRGIIPARLVAMDAVEVDSIDKPQPAPGSKEFEEIFQSKKPVADFDRFLESFGNSPLTLDALRGRLLMSRQDKTAAKQLPQLAEDYVTGAGRWGSAMELRAHVDIGVMLVKQEGQQDLALKHLNEAEVKFTDAIPKAWKLQSRLAKVKLLMGIDQADEGWALLKQLREDHPQDHEVAFLLAGLAEKRKQVDEAIELYAELVATPLAERGIAQNMAQESENSQPPPDRMPSRALTRLWKLKHGDTEELAGYLDKVYHRVVRSFVSEAVEPRKAGGGNRIALLELFTGAECPPCVAADLATGGLEATYAPSEVLVLRYHQHIPGPDALANEITLARFESYSGQATPMLFLNGAQHPNPGGYFEQSAGLYKQLRELVAPVLEEKSEFTLELSAEATAGKVTVKAQAMSDKPVSESVRLVIVLVEDKIEFLAGNGIRSHEMIVRAMPGGVEGVGSADGKLEFTKEVNLIKLKASLTNALQKFEKESNIRFVDKPLDLKKLHLVAFVQDNVSKKILQAAAIPVTGEVETADEPATAKETPEAKEKPAVKDETKSEKP